MEALGLNLGYVLLQIFMFGIAFVVLRSWVYKPILRLLEQRRNTIAQGLEDARVAADARQNAEREAEHVIADAQAKSAHIISEATERAEAAAIEVRNDADAEAAKARHTALAEVDAERTRILGELRGQVAALAIAAAQRIIGDSLDDQRQRQLVNEFFSGVKDGRVVVTEGQQIPGGAAAEVTSALPLTSQEQETVRRDVLESMGSGATVSFRVDPDILGGLVVRVGDKVIDGSVSGQLQHLRSSLR